MKGIKRREYKSKMIQHIGCVAVVVALMLMIIFSVLVQKFDQPRPASEREEFSCYVIDGYGQTINGYYSKEDGLWYLFVPSTQDLSALTLHVQGAVEESSAGKVNREAKTIVDAFADGDEVSLICGSETIRVVVKQSTLPSLHIVLADTTLDQVHKDKDSKYKKNSVYLADPEGEYDLTAEGSVELKGRGNSTWLFFDKKGYQIKFDSKTSILGMGKAKKWVLLANASDDSMMRTQLTYQMAEQMDMAFVPSFEYVDLWISGDYRGTYIIGEKVELGGSRLDLEDPKGVLFEQDDEFYKEEDYWFWSVFLQRYFALKESVEEDNETIILSAVDSFAAAVDKLAGYLYSTPSAEVTLEELSKMIDVDSFANYYLINEYTLNRESFATSFYWYKDGPEDVIHLGPIWDFDTCMGNDGAGYAENWGHTHTLFQYLLASPAFCGRVLELREAYRPVFEEMDANADTIYEEIKESAEMNYLRWRVLGEPNPKETSEDFCDTFEEAVETLKTWLKGRERAFSIPESRSVSSVVSADCTQLDIRFPDNGYESFRFAVWSEDGGQDDLNWYDGTKGEDGLWRACADLRLHNSAGIYRIDAYPNGGEDIIAGGRNYVEIAQMPSVWIDSTVAPDCTEMELIMEDTLTEHTQIHFAVWSAENGQDDLYWYPAVMGEDGTWSSSVDLSRHNSAGTYYVHAYSEDKGINTWTASCNVYVEKAVSAPERPTVNSVLTGGTPA